MKRSSSGQKAYNAREGIETAQRGRFSFLPLSGQKAYNAREGIETYPAHRNMSASLQ